MKKILLVIFIITIQKALPIPRNYGEFMWAMYQDIQGNNTIARHIFNHLLEQDKCAYIYLGYIPHLFTTEEYRTIISLTPTIKKHFPRHRDMQLTLAKSLTQFNKIKEADDIYITNAGEHPYHTESIYYGALSLAKRKEFQRALTLINEYLNNKVEQRPDFLFYFLKAQIYLLLKDEQQAIQSYEKALELNPALLQSNRQKLHRQKKSQWLFSLHNSLSGIQPIHYHTSSLI